MRFEGPQRYAIDFDSASYRVTDGRRNLSGLASRLCPKLYLIIHDGLPVYIGYTSQRLSSRFRLGWRATGANGYHGYRFRHALKAAHVDVWCLDDSMCGRKQAVVDAETIEAELVFAIRSQMGQWPGFQTEIHFHPSATWHRKEAARVLSQYARLR